MEFAEGKRLYSAIQSNTQKTRRDPNVSPNDRQPGIMRAAAYVVWKDEHTSTPFEEWWSEVHSIGVKPRNNGATKTAPQDEKTLRFSRQNRKSYGRGELRKSYMELFERNDFVPRDKIMHSVFGTSGGTLSTIRKSMLANGWELKQEAYGYRVIRRPVAVVAVESATTAPVPSPTPTITMVDGTQSLTAPICQPSANGATPQPVEADSDGEFDLLKVKKITVLVLDAMTKSLVTMSEKLEKFDAVIKAQEIQIQVLSDIRQILLDGSERLDSVLVTQEQVAEGVEALIVLQHQMLDVWTK